MLFYFCNFFGIGIQIAVIAATIGNHTKSCITIGRPNLSASTPRIVTPKPPKPTLKPIVRPDAMPTLFGIMHCAMIIVVAKEPMIKKPASTTDTIAKACVVAIVMQ